MLRPLVSVAALGSALWWAVAWWSAHPLLSLMWCGLWAAVLVLDYQLHLDTAPPPPTPPVVYPEVEDVRGELWTE